MSYEQLTKVRSDESDLTAREMEVYRAFLELAESENDVNILSRIWLKMHRRGVLRGEGM